MTPIEIRTLRERLGCSQQGLADRLNAVLPTLRADRNIISRWERGVNRPNAHAQAALIHLKTEAEE